MKKSHVAAVAGGLAVAGCSGGGAADNGAVEQRAAALQPGEYELVATIDALRSTDNTTPATKLKQGAAPLTTRSCVGPDNAIDPAAFAESGDKCTVRDPYVSNGRMSLQLICGRKGTQDITHQVDGKFKADSLEAKVVTTTYLSGSGDYEMTRSVTAKRVGDCTATAG